MRASISIIICTRGPSAELENTLASLSRAQMPPVIAAELLIVENGPPERARTRCSRFAHPQIRARYIHEPLAGKSNALNRSLREADGDILLFSDDDVRFPDHWIERMCEPIQTGRADAVAGGVKLAPHLLRPWMDRTMRAWLASTSDYLSPTAPSEMCGANMAVSRRAFDRIGGYDLELGPGVTNGGEESLVSWQLIRSGFRVAGALDVQVEHHLDPRRLQYGSWIIAARLKGRSRAYLLHHWHHRAIRFPFLRQLGFEAKLLLRLMVSPRRKAESEGIPPWELSYREAIACLAQYSQERSRTTHFSPSGDRPSARLTQLVNG